MYTYIYRHTHMCVCVPSFEGGYTSICWSWEWQYLSWTLHRKLRIPQCEETHIAHGNKLQKYCELTLLLKTASARPLFSLLSKVFIIWKQTHLPHDNNNNVLLLGFFSVNICIYNTGYVIPILRLFTTCQLWDNLQKQGAFCSPG